MLILLSLLFPCAGAVGFGRHHIFVAQLDSGLDAVAWVPRLERAMTLDRRTLWTSRSRMFRKGQSLVRDVAPAVTALFATNAPGRMHLDLAIVGHGSPEMIGGRTDNHERLDEVAAALVAALRTAPAGTSVRLFVDVCHAGALWDEFEKRAGDLPVNVRGFFATSAGSRVRLDTFGRAIDRTLDVLSAVRTAGRPAASNLDDELLGLATLVGAFAEESIEYHPMEAKRLRGTLDDRRVVEALVAMFAGRIFSPLLAPRSDDTARARQWLEWAVTDAANARLRRGLSAVAGDLADVAELLRLRAFYDDEVPSDRVSLDRLTEHAVEPLRADAVDVFLIYAADLFGFDSVLEAYWRERHRVDPSPRILHRLHGDIFKMFELDDADARRVRDDYDQLCESRLLAPE